MRAKQALVNWMQQWIVWATNAQNLHLSEFAIELEPDADKCAVRQSGEQKQPGNGCENRPARSTKRSSHLQIE